MTLEEYVNNMESAIFFNPPRKGMPHASPKDSWRYNMRGFGHGLKDFPTEDTDKVIQSLYTGWFMKLEFGRSDRPDVDAKEFFGWIRGARDE